MVTATECNFNLPRPGCLSFCSDPANKCDDNSNVLYCVARFLKAREDYPGLDDVENLKVNLPECKCLLMGPSTPLEIKLESVNHGNRACWSPYCRDGTSPKLDQLSRPSWWTDLGKCAAINFCILNIKDTTITQYGDSVFQIDNCDDDQLKENAGEEDLESTGDPVVDVPSDSGIEFTDDIMLAVAAGIMIVLLLMASSSSRTKKLEENLNSMKKKMGFKSNNK
jgi:hypothetical protein